MTLVSSKNIRYNERDNIVGVNLNRVGKTSSVPDVSFKFSSFNRPDNLDKTALNIAVDNSFDFYEDDNVVFIDHHISEELNSRGYKSNASMMVEHYDTVFKYFTTILNSYGYERVVVYMHHDIDGLCSGVVCLKVLKDALRGRYDENYRDNLKLLEVFGNYGDVDTDAKVNLTDYFESAEDVDVFDKKIRQYCKSLGRFFKATRAVFYDLENIDCDGYVLREPEVYNSLDSMLAESNLSNRMIKRGVLDQIHGELQKFWKFREVNLKSTLLFFNTLGQNRILNLIVDAYNREIERLVNSYVNPDTPAFEISIRFVGDKTNTVFKLLTIDTPFDCGRSVLWKYRSSLKYFMSVNKESKWKFNIADWGKSKDLAGVAKNIVCYNKMLRKLSFDGSGSAAYDVAASVFKGGGHSVLEEGRSLGSVVVDDEQLFLNSFVVTDVF